MSLTKRQVHLGDFFEEAQRIRGAYGKTELYSTGHSGLNDYLGGGFGREDNYEIVLLYGPTGVGKSTVALNLITPAIEDGKKVGLLILEDEMVDVSLRLAHILPKDKYLEANQSGLVLCLPPDALVKSWKLDDLLEYIEGWFINQGVDIILLDHLQFAFEGAESIKGENEWTAQRVFMQKLNFLMKRAKKTIILVSHVNKASGSRGMDKIVGSGAISQAATKVIEVSEDKVPDTIRLNLQKSRFTKKPGFHWCMKLDGAKLEPAA